MSWPKIRIATFPPKFADALSREIREACTKRGTAAAKKGGRMQLTSELVEKIVHEVLLAATHASLGPIPNKVATRGAPADNARIILLHDIRRRALAELGLSDGLHFESYYQSLAVELYTIVAGHIWGNPQGNPINPRSTFKRLQRAQIST